MARAVFIASDPQNRTVAELEDLIPELDGVTAWSVGSNGEVVVEFDRQQTSAATIEEALAGIGFRVQHVYSSPGGGGTDSRNDSTV